MPSSTPSTASCARSRTATRAFPAAPLGWYEEDPQCVGVPFFTMDHVEGDVPTDNLPYTIEGWVIEATPEQQSTMWSSADRRHGRGPSDGLARPFGLDWLGRPRRGRPGLNSGLSCYPAISSTWRPKDYPNPPSRPRGRGWFDHQPARGTTLADQFGAIAESAT